MNEKVLAIDPILALKATSNRVPSERARFIQRFENRFGNSEFLEIISQGSETVSAEEIKSIVGPVRLFSVDGNHATEFVLHDLQIAAQSLTRDGIIIVDDVFNIFNPGVQTAFHRFLTSSRDVVAFLIGTNKVYLCHRNRAEFYRQAVIDDGSLKLFAESRPFADSKVAVLATSALSRSAGTWRVRDPSRHLAASLLGTVYLMGTGWYRGNPFGRSRNWTRLIRKTYAYRVLRFLKNRIAGGGT